MSQTAQVASAGPYKTPFTLYAIVSITGAAVMILELLGTRIIGPFYGVSLYVWSSLIAVTLIALALGYFLGGFLADRYPAIRLAHVIAISALTTLAIPFLSGPILRATDSMGLRVGAFTSALVLFTLPLTALAMVGPYVIKRATRDLSGVGTASGTVYAISTVGSVAGTLLLGFYLLPQFGTQSIIFSLSLILTGLAIVVAWHERGRSTGLLSIWPPVTISLFVGIGAATGFTAQAKSVEGFTVQSEAESLYGWVRVVDDDRRGYRLLLSDASVISAVDLKQNRSLLGYQEVLSLLPAIYPNAARALLIGLGGGHVARDLKAQGVMTDTIEIDPAVAEAARRWFHVLHRRLRAHALAQPGNAQRITRYVERSRNIGPQLRRLYKRRRVGRRRGRAPNTARPLPSPSHVRHRQERVHRFHFPRLARTGRDRSPDRRSSPALVAGSRTPVCRGERLCPHRRLQST
jgi:predicted membrane-bound spermidine synthase